MNEKLDKYFDLLHPEFETLSPGEQLRLGKDNRFIAEHIYEIDSYYEDCMKEESRAQQMGWTEQEIIANAIKVIKTDKYFDLLHPEFETLSPGEQLRLGKDNRFIAEHIYEIDSLYENFCNDNKSDEEAIKCALEIIKGKEFSTQDIGKATINTPISSKEEVAGVENSENTRDNIKEGEEVGDDN